MFDEILEARELKLDLQQAGRRFALRARLELPRWRPVRVIAREALALGNRLDKKTSEP